VSTPPPPADWPLVAANKLVDRLVRDHSGQKKSAQAAEQIVVNIIFFTKQTTITITPHYEQTLVVHWHDGITENFETVLHARITNDKQASAQADELLERITNSFNPQ
jgi:hypothetical protein